MDEIKQAVLKLLRQGNHVSTVRSLLREAEKELDQAQEYLETHWTVWPSRFTRAQLWSKVKSTLMMS